LFFTDNRNQPRKINVDLANGQGLINTATYYTTEDQISVAKYNPYSCMELYEKSYIASNGYETTMKDVSSKFLPNGGLANFVSSTNNTTVVVNSLIGDIQDASSVYGIGSSVGYTKNVTGEIESTGGTVSSFTFDTALSQWTIVITGGVFPTLNTTQQIVFNPNPYYDVNFPGDPDYLEDKFVRFSYRFKFDDNEYSVFAPFTQIAFIPKQDGYFMYVKENTKGIQAKDDQADAYRSTVVYFVENKVDSIGLRIPLPFLNYQLQDKLKINEIDILYKEAQGLAVKVVDTITATQVNNSAGFFTVDSSATVSGVTEFTVSNIQGGIPVGGLVDGVNIAGKPKVTSFTPTDPNNPSTGGVVAIDLLESNITNGTILRVNDSYYYNYVYQSKKPFKTLPENNLTRVYDKVPVRALSQEVAGNRVIYGNFQNKHTPPQFLNYNVGVSQKTTFNINKRQTSTSGGTQSGTTLSLSTNSKVVVPEVGDFITILSGTGVIPPGTQVINVSAADPALSITVTLSNSVTNVSASDIILFQPGGDVLNTTSFVEYPNSSLKQNRNYQVGLVLSDRYSRTSSVILSSKKTTVGTSGFLGDTVYSPYLTGSINDSAWPGDSLKILFNETINSSFDRALGTPGLYNGDATSVDYNPLGWYSWKVVVKQTEQEYYNVYLPGIMAAYPEDTTLELGSTSHAVLINDNINKVPRDLNEVGPQQRTFASSIQLFGRVQNTATAVTSTTIGDSNEPFYPGRLSDTVSLISTVSDMFNYNPILGEVPRPNYFPQFYSVESNPFIARLSTERQIGQISTINYNTITATVAETATSSSIKLQDISGGDGTSNYGILPGDSVLGNFSNEIVVGNAGLTPGTFRDTQPTNAASTSNSLSFASLSGSILPGDIVTGTGIPAGTAVTVATSTSLDLTNVVDVLSGVSVTITSAPKLNLAIENSTGTLVNTAVTVEVGQTIVVQPAINPGLQYLAVYETEPVESLLDIYWETSSSGLVSDLNNAIIDDSQGGASLGNINTAPFDEAITVGESVTQTPITILDNFGSPVDPNNINNFELTEIRNQVPGQVLNPNNPYFQLVQPNTGVNQFEVRVTQNYFNNIYYGEANTVQNEAHRNFVLTFEAEINNLPTVFTLNLNLANVNPTISEPDPSGSDNFLRTTDQEDVATIKAQNGAANNQFQGVFADGNCEITSIVRASTGQSLNTTGNSAFFRIPPESVITGGQSNIPGVANWTVKNNFGEYIPIDQYDLTVRVQDAGGVNDADTVSFSINYGVTVGNVKQLTFRQKFTKKDCTNNIARYFYSDSWYNDIVIFEVVSGGATNQQGFYIYNGPWNGQTAWENQGGYNVNNNYTSPYSWFSSFWPNAPCSSTGINIGTSSPACSMFGAGQMKPLINQGPNTFLGSGGGAQSAAQSNGNQITINHSLANSPAEPLRTDQSGCSRLLFDPDPVNGAANVLNKWFTERTSQQIHLLEPQFTNGQYAGTGFSGGWGPVQQIEEISITDEDYNINDYVFTII